MVVIVNEKKNLTASHIIDYVNGYYINVVPSGHLAGFKFVVFVNTKKITSTSSNDTVSAIFIFDIEKLINVKKTI